MQLSATDHCEFITLVAGKRPNLLIAGNNDEVYDKKPQRYAEDNVMQWLIWNLSNNNKRLDSARVILLRLTTDGHKASRGLSLQQ